MPNYDPSSPGSVLLYMRRKFGAGVFEDSARACAILRELSPVVHKLYGEALFHLMESGAMDTLEVASRNNTWSERALIKARDALENKAFLPGDFVEYLLNELRLAYGLKASAPSARQAAGLDERGERGACGDNVTYTLNAKGLLTISGAGPMRDFDWEDVSAWRNKRNAISHVVIQDGVTSVGECAFHMCSSLTSVEIPDSVTKIGRFAFYDTRLKSVTIPGGVTEIGVSAFRMCMMLSNVTICDGVRLIREGAFKNCWGLKSLTIPDSVTEIEPEAFHDCTFLNSVSLSARTKFKGGLFHRTFPRGVKLTRRT